MSLQAKNSLKTGEVKALYIHLPFCSHVCHYCDFAKTSNYNDELASDYLKTLKQHLLGWLDCLNASQVGVKIESVFFGGGSPSLFSHEYQDLMQLVLSYCSHDPEVTIEANPEHISEESLAAWQQVGFNRLSMGVQSFQDNGLQALTRKHSGDAAKLAVNLANQYFKNINIDLIYGWSGQTAADWQSDLSLAVELKVPHLSLYNLTYEPATVFGRRLARGVINDHPEASILQYYRAAMQYLRGAAYDHEEVSNWSLEGYSCRHNWAYWGNHFYLAIGSGAHGFLPIGTWGTRYVYPKEPRRFVAMKNLESQRNLAFDSLSFERDQRNKEMMLTEYVATSLRTSRGVAIEMLQEKLDLGFYPTVNLQRALDSGLAAFKNGHLIFTSEEWFREASWAVQVLESFKNK